MISVGAGVAFVGAFRAAMSACACVARAYSLLMSSERYLSLGRLILVAIIRPSFLEAVSPRSSPCEASRCFEQ